MFSKKKNLKRKGQVQGLGWFFDMISVKAHDDIGVIVIWGL